MQFDEEGGMVQDIDETIGKTWDEMKAEYGQEGPKLPEDKQAMCVLPEAEVKLSARCAHWENKMRKLTNSHLYTT